MEQRFLEIIQGEIPYYLNVRHISAVCRVSSTVFIRTVDGRGYSQQYTNAVAAAQGLAEMLVELEERR